MPSSDAFGAHYVLRQYNPGRSLRLEDIITEAHAEELTVRREVDDLVLDGQVKRLYVGEHVMVKKTDEFDPDDRPDVEVPGDDDSDDGPTVLDVEEYERPGRDGLRPAGRKVDLPHLE